MTGVGAAPRRRRRPGPSLYTELDEQGGDVVLDRLLCQEQSSSSEEVKIRQRTPGWLELISPHTSILLPSGSRALSHTPSVGETPRTATRSPPRCQRRRRGRAPGPRPARRSPRRRAVGEERLPNNASRERIGTPRNVRIGRWCAGNPEEQGSPAMRHLDRPWVGDQRAEHAVAGRKVAGRGYGLRVQGRCARTARAHHRARAHRTRRSARRTPSAVSTIWPSTAGRDSSLTIARLTASRLCNRSWSLSPGAGFGPVRTR